MENKTRFGKLLNQIKSAENKLDDKRAKKRALEADEESRTFSVLTDEEVALVLAHRAHKLRVSQEKTQADITKGANLSSASTYAHFEQNGRISLINFIKVMRTLGRLHELEVLLKGSLSQVLDKFEETASVERQRVRKK